jgi:hypothetical protein
MAAISIHNRNRAGAGAECNRNECVVRGGRQITPQDWAAAAMEIAVEAKATASVAAQHLKGLRAVIEDHPRIRRRIVVCLERTPRRADDGIEILPAGTFLEQLKHNSLLPSA